VLLQREALLTGAALLIQCAPAGVSAAARHIAERMPGVVTLGSREPVHLNRKFLRFDVEKPKPLEQKRLWQLALGPAAQSANGTIDDLAEQFRLSAKTIFATGSLTTHGTGAIRTRDLWNLCRAFSRPRLEDLAQRLVPAAGWDDLVLPELPMQTLRHLASQARQRMKVYENWGFSAKGRRGLGISALFSGESGVGKTLAAEVLANDLQLDLYRVDVAAVVSKYIGETSKNMREVFDAAEEGGVLLLFDEADALFGKRGEVKDSHDRYANIDVSYLLQRMEAYQGLSILTTNMKTAVDRSFQRRLRFTVNFPFPDTAQREAIWSRVFPPETPTHELDFRKLAQLNVAGGNIRNIALNAAFMAAESKTPVVMAHILNAARFEAQKIDRALSEAEIRGWV
jgi:SpoVK/Ycf46/Vps4 family AAA+-type ATPase